MIQVFGRLHPLLVHFPIALLLAALLAEVLRPRARKPSEGGYYCLVLGTLGAVAAAGSGWVFAEHDAPGMADVLFRHRWTGVGTAVAALLTLYAATRWRAGAQALAGATRAGLGLTALLAGFAGHFGGEMVYGEGFVLEPLREERDEPRKEGPGDGGTESVLPAVPPATVALDAPVEVVEDAPPAPEVRTVDYLADVRPILERWCYECHGDRKRPKGDLKLTDMASVFTREADEPAIVPGDPEASLLYRRIVLPAEDLDVMPPDDGPVPADEVEVVRRWIAEGAHWEEPPPAEPAAGAEGGR